MLSVLTNENGRVQQLLPVNTDYTVVVERDGYGEARQRIDVNEGSTAVSPWINRTDALSLSAETTEVLAGNSLRVTVEAVSAPTETAEPTAEPTEEPTAEPTEEPTAEPTTADGGDGGSPGFLVVTALGGLLGCLLALRRRR